jgi:hypothetical protein
VGIRYYRLNAHRGKGNKIVCNEWQYFYVKYIHTDLLALPCTLLSALSEFFIFSKILQA